MNYDSLIGPGNQLPSHLCSYSEVVAMELQAELATKSVRYDCSNYHPLGLEIGRSEIQEEAESNVADPENDSVSAGGQQWSPVG